MSVWLLSIAGVTVIGVLVELLLTDSPMSKFVRSIYAFFILFVIVQPLPAFFNNAAASVGAPVNLNNELMTEINRQTATARQQAAQTALANSGFPNCIVTVFGDKVYVNAAAHAADSTNSDRARIISIVAAVMGVRPDAVEVFI